MNVSKEVAQAIRETLESPNVADSNMEAANVVDALAFISGGAHRIASAIYPKGAIPSTDEYGNTVGSLTEAVMSVAAALNRIADAIGEDKV